MSIDITHELQKDKLNPSIEVVSQRTISWRTLSWLFIGTLLCALAFILPEQASVPVTLTATSDAIAIEDVQLGWRVVGENPNGPESYDAEPNETTWKKVVLHGTAENGTAVEVEFLRSPEWIAKNNAIVGQTIDLELSEGHLSGIAQVVSLDACPEIKPGNGPVVTGLFRHRCKADELVRVTVDADIPPIVGTYNHPFWSETRQEFVNAEDLNLGEQLRCIDESIVQVSSVERVLGAKPVFNLETHNQHVYAVGTAGMLVHNMCGKDDGLPIVNSKKQQNDQLLDNLGRRINNGQVKPKKLKKAGVSDGDIAEATRRGAENSSKKNSDKIIENATKSNSAPDIELRKNPFGDDVEERIVQQVQIGKARVLDIRRRRNVD